MRTIAMVVALAAATGCSSSDEEDTAAETALALESFTVEPGAQGLRCQTFANPTGEEMDVDGWSSFQAPGGHHVLVFAIDGATDIPMDDCEEGPSAPGVGRTLVYQSQTAGNGAMSYPTGVAARVGPTQGFLVQIHYLNATDGPLTVSNSLAFTRMAGRADAVMAPLMFENRNLAIPPGGATLARSCTLPDDVELVWLASHMHQRGAAFRAAIGPEEIYASAQPEGRTAIFDPVRPVTAGAQVTIECTYWNDTSEDIHFGPSLEDDEMCNLVGAYVDRTGDGALLSCEAAPGGCLSCSEALFGGSGDLCDDGDPSSADTFAAFQACSCGEDAPCGEDCAASGCAGAVPDDGCRACLETTCAESLDACLGD
jgi:hypothetical protein